MKINKKQINESILVEADEVIDNPGTASNAEVADAVEAGLEAEGQGDVEISKKQAAEIAKDAKDVAKKIEAKKFVPSASVNELTRVLDEALEASLSKKDEEDFFGTDEGVSYNVLVSGLPGSGKTAIVKQWAKHNGVNLVYVDAKNDDLEAFINGFTVRDSRYPDKNKITKGTSDGLVLLEKERSVLFLDELNRQTKKQIRASLLTLINEHRITGDNDNPEDKDGYHYFKNLLFTVACINPALPTERGADDLDDAEDSRFALKVDFDSNFESALDFFSKVFDDKANAIVERGPEVLKARAGLYTNYMMEKALSLHIINHPIFTFDTRDDLEELRNYGAGKRYTMFNMRMFLEGIEISLGRKDKFLAWVKKRSNFRPAIIEMLEEILMYYNDPEITLPLNEPEEEEEPIQDVNQEVNVNAENDDIDDEYDFSDVDDEDESDAGFFGGNKSGQSGARTSITPNEVLNKIKAFNF